MSAATADRATVLTQGAGRMTGAKMAASATIYENCGVMFDASGYLTNAADTSGCFPAGVCAGYKVGSATAGVTDGVYYRAGIFPFVASGAAQAWVGVKVYWVDNQTVALVGTTSNDVLAGVCVGFTSASEVLVDINAYFA